MYVLVLVLVRVRVRVRMRVCKCVHVPACVCEPASERANEHSVTPYLPNSTPSLATEICLSVNHLPTLLL